MKTFFISIFCLFCLLGNCQNADKFTYSNTRGNGIAVELKADVKSLGEVKLIMFQVRDDKWLNHTMDSICKVSFSEEKRNLLSKIERRVKGMVIINYFPDGKVYQIKFYLSREAKEVLTDADLSTLYDNLKNYRMDMSKIQLEYPENKESGVEYIWGFTYPIYRERQ